MTILPHKVYAAHLHRRHWWRDRTLWTAILSLWLVVAVGGGRHGDESSGLMPDEYWRLKSNWRECADVVIAGDSRVYRGFSPEEIGRVLPGVRCVNYGYSGQGYSKDYLLSLEKLLSRDGQRKFIVLGFSPFSLTDRAARDNGFAARPRTTHPKSAVGRLNERLMHFLRPLSPRELRYVVRREAYYEIYCPDGWIAGTRVPELPNHALRTYKGLFRNNQVSETIVGGVLQAVGKWAKAGIVVCGLRVPTSTRMLTLEKEHSGFDEADFIARFQDAGGVWLAMDTTAYHSYDGSHIHSNMAAKVSRPYGAYWPNDAGKMSADLAVMLREQLSVSYACSEAVRLLGEVTIHP